MRANDRWTFKMDPGVRRDDGRVESRFNRHTVEGRYPVAGLIVRSRAVAAQLEMHPRLGPDDAGVA